ncbi:Nn.00g042510.m01.CDS01 [Neocucurbitaria sp. VM-36]
MGNMPPSGMPPEYTSNTSIPRYGGGLAPGGGGGMPGAGMNPYASYPGPPPSPPSSDGAPPPQSTRRPSGQASKQHARVPMGAYTAGASSPRQPSRSHKDSPISALLNRGQPAGQRVGPSGNAWLDENSWLDACTCTTNCKCRKSHRVVYRGQESRGRGGDENEDEAQYISGEIRYVLKDDLGKDCGDHSACKKSETGSEKGDKSRKGKNKKDEDKERKEQFAGFKEELLEALDERFQDMKKEGRQQGRHDSPSASPFGRPNMGPSPFTMGEAGMDPRLAQHMGMAMGGNPYGIGMPGMGRMPPDMTDPMGKRSMRPPGMPMGPMAAPGMPFEDDMSMADMDGIGPMGMGDPYASMMAKRSMPPDFMSRRRRRGGGNFGGMDMGIDSMGLYGRTSGMRGRGGMMGGRRPGRGGGLRPDFDSDDFDIGPSRRPGMSKQSNDEDEAPYGNMTRGGGPGIEDEDEIHAIRRRAANTPATRPGGRPNRDRERQPRAETDDDDAY